MMDHVRITIILILLNLITRLRYHHFNRILMPYIRVKRYTLSLTSIGLSDSAIMVHPVAWFIGLSKKQRYPDVSRALL